MVRRVLLLGLATLLLAAPATASAKRTVPRGWLGVMAGLELTGHPSLWPAEFAKMPRNGAEAVRTVFNWDEIERAKGSYTFDQTDGLVAAAARRRLPLLVTVLSAPDWASDDTPETNNPIRTPRNPRDYARFMVTLVHRYGPKGSFWRTHRSVPKIPIRRWQIWNEPSLTFFWNHPRGHHGQGQTCGRQPWAKSYAALLEASHRAIHRADPRAKVILAGFPNYSWAYICALYHQKAGHAFDEAAIHPYSLAVSGVIRIIDRVRRMMAKHGDARKPLLLTELSWPAAKGKISYDPGFNVTARGQVQRIEKVLPALAKLRKRDHIGGVYWYTWVSEFDPAFLQPFQYSGLRQLHKNGTVTNRPGLAAFRRVARRLEGKR